MDRMMCIFRRKIETYGPHFKSIFGYDLIHFCGVDGFDMERFLTEFPNGYKENKWLIDRLLMKSMKLRSPNGNGKLFETNLKDGKSGIS